MVRSGLLAAMVVVFAAVVGCPSSGGGGTDAGATNGGHDGGGAGAAGGGAKPAGDAGPSFDAGTDPNRNKVMAGAICARLATIQCAGEAACCTSPGRDFKTCQASLADNCKQTLLLDDLSKAAPIGFDPVAASTAFGELEHRVSVCDPSAAAWALSADGFERSFTGTLGVGDNCEPKGGLSGASLPDLSVSLASCRLGDGLACLPGDKGWACAPRAQRGGRCFSDLNCGDGLYCDNPQGMFNGMCTARKAAGEKCSSDTQCTSFICKGAKCTADDDVQASYCLK
jgi:hypothetical protein